MNTGIPELQESGASTITISKRLRKAAAMLLLLGLVAFATTGCYDDRYGHARYGTGYYASSAPYYGGGYAPYYGGDSPYYGDGYGYGYGPTTSVGIGISSGRSRYYAGRPRYRNYRRGAQYRRRGEYRRTNRAAVRNRATRTRVLRQNPPQETDGRAEPQPE